MKKLILILLFSASMFSSSSYAEWTKVSGNAMGTVYVDYERIRKHDGYVYWWELSDFLKPSPNGMLSAKYYNQGDCKLFRFKRLSYSYHNEPMGDGTAIDNFTPKNPELTYPIPDSIGEITLKQVCNR